MTKSSPPVGDIGDDLLLEEEVPEEALGGVGVGAGEPKEELLVRPENVAEEEEVLEAIFVDHMHEQVPVQLVHIPRFGNGQTVGQAPGQHVGVGRHHGVEGKQHSGLVAKKGGRVGQELEDGEGRLLVGEEGQRVELIQARLGELDVRTASFSRPLVAPFHSGVEPSSSRRRCSSWTWPCWTDAR